MMIKKSMLWRKIKKRSTLEVPYGKKGGYYYFKEVREDSTEKVTLAWQWEGQGKEGIV